MIHILLQVLRYVNFIVYAHTLGRFQAQFLWRKKICTMGFDYDTIDASIN